MSQDTDLVYGNEPLYVHVMNLKELGIGTEGEKRPKECRVTYRTITLTAANPVQQLLGVDPGRREIHCEALDFPIVITSNTQQANDVLNGPSSVISTPPGAISQPAVPASGVAVQNTNQFAVQVVVAGFTATQVFVNGIQVGVTNGTYTVPANGAISITYTVAGTMTWTSLQPNTITSLGFPNGRVLNPLVGEYIVPGGQNEVWFSAAQFPSRIGITVVREF